MLKSMTCNGLRILGLIVCVGGMLLPLSAAAQTRVHDVDLVHQRNECRLARQVLLQGQPANKRNWAMSFVTSCGAEGGRVLAAMLDRHRTRTAHSHDLEVVTWAAAWIRDRSVYNTAISIAGDPTAGVAARVNAIRVLHGQFEAGSVQAYEHYVTPRTYEETLMTGHSSLGEPLPADATQQIRDRLHTLSEEETVPADVRTAARRVSASANGLIRFRETCPPGTPSAECSRRLWERQVREQAKP